MNTIYFVRHQAEGVCADFPFAQEPTPQQIADVKRWADARHRAGDYWVVVVKKNAIGPDDAVPQGEAIDESANVTAIGGHGRAPQFRGQGRGHVRNPS